MDNQKNSSIVKEQVQKPKEAQLQLPTWGVIVVLIIAFFLLKTFIYIKDGKRHGK